MSEIEDFIAYLNQNIRYWQRQPISEKKKLEGVTFSILVSLDGCAGSFDGNIDTLAKLSEGMQLHQEFYR